LILNNLRDEDPKTYIIVSIVFVILIMGGVGCMLYLTAMTKYEGYHIIFAIAGGVLLFLGMLWLINIIKSVSSLKTDADWLKRRIKLTENAKLEIILEKMKKEEPLDPSELKLIKNLEADILEPKQGEPSG
jgi:hypothetical protein